MLRVAQVHTGLPHWSIETLATLTPSDPRLPESAHWLVYLHCFYLRHMRTILCTISSWRRWDSQTDDEIVRDPCTGTDRDPSAETPWTETPLDPPGQRSPWTDPPEKYPPNRDPPVLTSSGGHRSGWYASYWNVFCWRCLSYCT